MGGAERVGASEPIADFQIGQRSKAILHSQFSILAWRTDAILRPKILPLTTNPCGSQVKASGATTAATINLICGHSSSFRTLRPSKDQADAPDPIAWSRSWARAAPTPFSIRKCRVKNDRARNCEPCQNQVYTTISFSKISRLINQ